MFATNILKSFPRIASFLLTIEGLKCQPTDRSELKTISIKLALKKEEKHTFILGRQQVHVSPVLPKLLWKSWEPWREWTLDRALPLFPSLPFCLPLILSQLLLLPPTDLKIMQGVLLRVWKGRQTQKSSLRYLGAEQATTCDCDPKQEWK